MAVTCRSPRLLDASFHETARLRPAALSCQLQLTDASAATMTLTRQDPVPAMHDWVELYAARGSLGLYRATALQRNHDRDTTVTLRHAIDTLSDNVWRVRDYDYSGTVAGYLAQLLSYQTHVYWQLGTVEDTGSWKRSGINYTRLSELLWELAGERHGYYFTYDFSTTPWTLNFLALPSAPAAEWRLTRNVHTLQLIRNDEDLCTRLYCTVSTTTATTPQGYTPEELDGRTVPVTDLGTVTVTDSAVHTYDNLEAQAIYGIVEKTADIDAEDVANPAAWAAEFLADRAEPTVQITIDGYELAAATGDSWDAFDLGKMTRCILADSGEILHERVVAITYPDLLGEPEHVTVELANRLAKFTDSLASVQTAASSAKATAKKASRGGGSSTKDMEHWAMIVKKAVESLDGTGLVDLWETGIELDPQSGAKLYSLFQGPGTSSQGVLQVMNNEVKAKASQTTVDGLTTRMGQAEIDIDANAAAITLKASQTDVDALGTRVSQAEIDIDGAEAAIALKASQTDVDALGSRVSQAEIDIDGAEAAIALKVAKGDVATQLAVEVGNVTISNGNLVVDGYITSQGLITTLGSFSDPIVTTDYLAAPSILLNGESLGAHSITWIGGGLTMFAADANLDLRHYHDIEVTENNGVVTITQGAAQSTPGSDSFNIADTQFYKDAVASAETRGQNSVHVNKLWDENVCTCIPSAGTGLGATITIDKVIGTPTQQAPNLYPITIKDGTTSVLTFTVDASARYDAGETAGYTDGYSDGVNDGYATGAASVTVDSVLKYQADDYDATTHNYTVYVRGTASNSKTLDNSLTVSGASAYNAGSSAGYSSGYSTGYSTGYSAGQAAFSAKNYAHYGALYEYNSVDGYSRVGTGYWFLSPYRTMYEKTS